jgi:hypothetical protein
LPKVLDFNPIYKANLFIYNINRFTAFYLSPLFKILPPHLAKAKAASFPLGNIIPYNNYLTLYMSPSYNYADVPVAF